MMTAYSMIAMEREHTSLLLCLAWVEISANLARSKGSSCIELWTDVKAF